MCIYIIYIYIIFIEFSHVCFIDIQRFRCELVCASGVKHGKADIYTNIMQALGFLAMHIETGITSAAKNIDQRNRCLQWEPHGISIDVEAEIAAS